MDDQITDSLTLALDRVQSVHEYQGHVIDSITVAGDPDNGVTVEWAGTAKQRLISGTTNDAAAVQGVSEPGKCVLFHQCTLRIGPTDDALTSGDDWDMSQFSLQLNRNKVAQARNSLFRMQSKENGHRDSVLNFTIPRYESDQFLTWMESDTALQGVIIMTNGTNTKEWRYSHMSVEQATINQSGDDQAPVPVQMRLYENKSVVNAVTGWDFDPEVQLYES